jgi:hypothetical protein
MFGALSVKLGQEVFASLGVGVVVTEHSAAAGEGVLGHLSCLLMFAEPVEDNSEGGGRA